MKKILGLVLAALVVMAGIGGATWASFNDQAVSSSNVITAGTLYMDPTHASANDVLSGTKDTTNGSTQLTRSTSPQALTGNINFTKLTPGNAGTYEWDVNNSGTLDGYLVPSFTATFAKASPVPGPKSTTLAAGTNSGLETNTTGGTGGDAPAGGALANFLGVKVSYKVGTTQGASDVVSQAYVLGASGFVAASHLTDANAAFAALNSSTGILLAHGNWAAIIVQWSTVDGANYGADTASPYYINTDNTGHTNGITAATALHKDNIWQGDSATVGATFALNQK